MSTMLCVNYKAGSYVGFLPMKYFFYIYCFLSKMKKNSLPMAVLFQKRRYFLLGSHHLRDAALLKKQCECEKIGESSLDHYSMWG